MKMEKTKEFLGAFIPQVVLPMVLVFMGLYVTMSFIESGTPDEPVVVETDVSHNLHGMEFGREPGLLTTTEAIYVTTETITYAWNVNAVTFIASDNENDRVVFDTTDQDEPTNIRVYLSPDSIQRYSDVYAKGFLRTMPIETP